VRDPELEHAPWDRRAKITFLALAALMLASLPWLVHPYYEADVETNDAAMYILSAEALLSGQGYAYVGEPFTIRPPGVSVMLAPILHWRGLDFGAMNLLVSLFGAAGILALFAWLRPRVGTFVAAAFGLFVWLNPGFRHFSNQVMSDVPGVSLTIVLFLVERWADRRRSWKRDLVLGLAIGLTSYVRTILILVLPAVVLARMWRNLTARAGPIGHAGREPWMPFLARRVAPVFLGTLLVFLPWSLRNSAVAPRGAVDQNFIHSYGTGLFHVDGGDPDSPLRPLSDVTNRMPDRAEKVLSLLGSRLDTNEGGAAHIAVGALIALASLYLLWKQKRSAEIYFFMGVFVLLVYFGFRDRLALPLYVLGWAALAEILCGANPASVAPALRRGLVAAGLVAFAVFGFRYREGWAELEEGHHARIEQSRAWNERLPADARVATAIGWHHSVYLGRPVYSLYFAIRRKAREADARGLKGPARNEMSGAEEVIDKYGINTVILDANPSDRSLLPYFQLRYGNGVRAGEGWIFRVRP
jgi:hypothetical protein